MSRIYLASSWRNAHQPAVLEQLRDARHEVYDFRNPEPGVTGFAWSDIDPHWEGWSPWAYRHALEDDVAKLGYGRDWRAMQRSDVCVLLLPSGRSAHIEAGYFVGHPEKSLHVLLLEPQEPELMYRMADGIHLSVAELLEALR